MAQGKIVGNSEFLNGRLAISSSEAEEMWTSGYSGVIDSHTGRVSENGQWVIKKRRPSTWRTILGLELRPTEAVAACNQDYLRLRRLGMNMLNFASVVASGPEAVYTVTPYVRGLKRPSTDQYRRAVYPIAKVFLAEKARLDGDPAAHMVDDIYGIRQFSAIDQMVFLHDISSLATSVRATYDFASEEVECSAYPEKYLPEISD